MKNKILNKIKSGDQKTLLIIAGSLIVIALLSKILLIFGIIILTFVLYNMYKKKQVKNEERTNKKIEESLQG